MQTLPRIVGLSVRDYKNLSRIWLPWSDGIALFGRNGSGKTNLLECLALLLGSDETLRLAAPRLGQPRPGDLSLVMQVTSAELPWAPDQAVPHDVEADERLLAQLPGLRRLVRDRQWWLSAGVQEGESWLAGLSAAGVPDRVLELLEACEQAPLVRYDLSSITLPEGQGLPTVRELSRVLLLEDPPAWLLDHAGELPDVFAPLRAAVAAGTRSGLVPVLELPLTGAAPAVLQWLPRQRSSQEALEALREAYEGASRPVEGLAEALAELPLADGVSDPDPIWWLHVLAQAAAGGELQQTQPHLEVEPRGEYGIDLALVDTRRVPPVEVGRTCDDDAIEAFSAGERRWVDEALASAARELEAFGLRASWQAAVLGDVDQDVAMAMLLEVSSEVERVLAQNDYWSAEALELVVRALDVPLLQAVQRLLAQYSDPLRREVLRSMVPGAEALAARVTVRAVDEPEAHLHPAAQRHAAAALESLRRRGQDVVIASHSEYFLSLGEWQLTHVQMTPEGSTVSLVEPQDLRAGSSLCEQLGWTTGGLLVNTTRVLIVEGAHDQAVLDALFGPQLRAAGVAVLRMHGTDNLLATAELDFVEQFLHVPVHVLTDHTRTDRVAKGQWQSDEEERLVKLGRRLARAGRSYRFHGLRRPDVVCYLSDQAVAQLHPGFPGWSPVLERFLGLPRRPSFKKWLLDRYDTDLVHLPQVEAVLRVMATEGLHPAGDLARVVSGILSDEQPSPQTG